MQLLRKCAFFFALPCDFQQRAWMMLHLRSKIAPWTISSQLHRATATSLRISALKFSPRILFKENFNPFLVLFIRFKEIPSIYRLYMYINRTNESDQNRYLVITEAWNMQATLIHQGDKGCLSPSVEQLKLLKLLILSLFYTHNGRNPFYSI